MSQIFGDTFTDTNGVNVVSHTPNVGTSWGVAGSATVAWDINANKMQVYLFAGGTELSWLYANPVSATPNNVSIEATITRSSRTTSAIGLMLRYTDTNNYAVLLDNGFASPNNFMIQEYVAGVPTTLAETSLSVTEGVPITLKFKVNGSAYSAYVNGVHEAALDCTGALTSGKAGLWYVTNAGSVNTIDDVDVQSLNAVIEETVTDGVVAGGEAARSVSSGCTLTETVALGESPAVAQRLGAMASEAMVLDGHASHMRILEDTLTDGVGFSEATVLGMTYGMVLTQGVTLTDVRAAATTFGVALAQAVAIVETVIAVVDSPGDTIVSSITVERNVSPQAWVRENVSPTVRMEDVSPVVTMRNVSPTVSMKVLTGTIDGPVLSSSRSPRIIGVEMVDRVSVGATVVSFGGKIYETVSDSLLLTPRAAAGGGSQILESVSDGVIISSAQDMAVPGTFTWEQNRRSGLTKIFDDPCQTGTPPYGALYYYTPAQSDVTVPAGYGPNVLEQLRPTGSTYGGDHQMIFYPNGWSFQPLPPKNLREVYMCFLFKVNPEYRTHGITEKFFYFNAYRGLTGPYDFNSAPCQFYPGDPSFPGYVNVDLNRDGPRIWFFYLRDPQGVGAPYPPTNPDTYITKGQWHLLEFSQRINTPGNRDGHVKLWIDGQVHIFDEECVFGNATFQQFFYSLPVDYLRGAGPDADFPVLAPGSSRRFAKITVWGSET